MKRDKIEKKKYIRANKVRMLAFLARNKGSFFLLTERVYCMTTASGGQKNARNSGSVLLRFVTSHRLPGDEADGTIPERLFANCSSWANRVISHDL